MTLALLADAVHREAGVGRDWDGVVYRVLAKHMRNRGYPNTIDFSTLSPDVAAEIVAAASHEISVAKHHTEYP